MPFRSVLAPGVDPCSFPFADGGVVGGKAPFFDQNDAENGVDYPDPIGRNFLPSLSAEIDKRLGRISGCGKTWVIQPVLLTENPEYKIGDKIIKKVVCQSFFCAECGSKGGIKHRMRKQKVYEMLKRGVDLENLRLRQFIFTIPENLRSEFMSRKKIVEFRRFCVELVRGLFPDRLMIIYVHLFGDQDMTFKPHINIHIVESGHVGLFVKNEILAYMKECLSEFLHSSEIMNLQYSFKKSRASFSHAIKYMTRPVPSYQHVKPLIDRRSPCDDVMLSFLLIEMRGFQYISYPRKEWGVVESSDISERVGFIKGVKLGRGDRVHMSWGVFIDIYRNHERREIFPGVYHIHGGRLSTGGLLNVQS